MNIYDFEANLIKFSSKKILNSSLIWADLDSLAEVMPCISGEWSEDAFLDHFAYAIEGNQHFEEIDFSKNESKDMYAEIYGGSINGGSGRAGNMGPFQVKGLGQTMLVGKYADSWHSYGCFSLVEALHETINSAVLNEILPYGTAKCFGLILTGEKTAWPPNSDVAGRGALLVRESCLRPAHFFCNDRFTPKKKFKHLFLNDKLRIKKVTQKFSLLMSDVNGYELFLKDFLNKYASQFAFSKIFRIFHGAINASNVSLDGKWLDLTTASFVDAGKNYKGAEAIPSFYAEHCTVINYVEKLVSLYNIYNVEAPLKHNLAKYYSEKFTNNVQKHIFTLLGLNADTYSADALAENNDFSIVVSSLWHAIVKDDVFIKDLPSVLPESDPLVNLLEEWFAALYESFNAGEIIKKEISSSANFVKFFFKHNSIVFGQAEQISILHLAAIRSLKKSYFSEFFFKKRVSNIIEKNIKTSDISFFYDLIEDSKNVAKWVFNDNQLDVVTMFESHSLNLWFDARKGFFEALYLEKLIKFYSEIELLNFIVSLKDEYFIIGEFSFKNSLIKICNVIAGRPNFKSLPITGVEDLVSNLNIESV